MIDHEAQLKLQAFLDGELPEAERCEVASRLAKDSEAAQLLAELSNTREALKGGAMPLKVPESREFYWSKIQRGIIAQQQTVPERKAELVSVFALLRRFLMPAAAVATLALVALVAVFPSSGGGGLSSLESESNDAGTFTYRDYSTKTTLVWLSYPAENEVAQPDEAGTVP